MKIKHLLIFLGLIGISSSTYGQDNSNYKKFKRCHFTFEAGYSKNNISEIITNEFASELYQGSKSFLTEHLSIGGLPNHYSENKPIVNLAFDVNLSHRFKIGIGVNGIPETQVIGFVNKDSIDPGNPNLVYDKVEELVRGTTLKFEALYALKPYYGKTAIGWELAVGGGITSNFISVKQKYLIQTVDTTTQEIIANQGEYSKKSSSIGAFVMMRLDVHLTHRFSLVGDFNWMFDTGVFIDETKFDFYDATQQINAHQLKFNSYLIAVGGALHF